MAFELKSIIPMGRSYEDYRDMFALSAADLSRKILGCGDGPASFNAEATRAGQEIISIDPLYTYDAADIAERIDETFEENWVQVQRNSANFTWTRHKTLADWKAARRAAMDAFLIDYEEGKAQGRYLEGGLPRLPFADLSFDLALSSHFLFLYSAHLDEDFHVNGILELLRVAREVRIFPLVDLNARRSIHLEAVARALEGEGFLREEVETAYEVQRGASAMLRIVRRV
jgi:hypothetical protein